MHGRGGFAPRGRADSIASEHIVPDSHSDCQHALEVNPGRATAGLTAAVWTLSFAGMGTIHLGMPTLIELDGLEANVDLCRRLGLAFIELNWTGPADR